MGSRFDFTICTIKGLSEFTPRNFSGAFYSEINLFRCTPRYFSGAIWSYSLIKGTALYEDCILAGIKWMKRVRFNMLQNFPSLICLEGDTFFSHVNDSRKFRPGQNCGRIRIRVHPIKVETTTSFFHCRESELICFTGNSGYSIRNSSRILIILLT